MTLVTLYSIYHNITTIRVATSNTDTIVDEIVHSSMQVLSGHKVGDDNLQVILFRMHKQTTYRQLKIQFGTIPNAHIYNIFYSTVHVQCTIHVHLITYNYTYYLSLE